MAYYLDIVAHIGIFMVLAMSLNVICGLTGLLQLGHAGFFAIGAYGAGLITIYVQVAGFPGFLLGALVGMILAGIFAVLIGVPCLRLRGDYLAIATLGFGEIVRLVLQNIYFPPAPGMEARGRIGGATGISLPAEALFSSWWFIWIIVLVTYVLLVNMKRSAIGRAFLAIREDEIAARAMGVHLPYYKTLSFVISAAFAGLAGALFAHKQGTMTPGDFGLLRTIEILLMVVLGGLGSFSGAALAAILLIVSREWLGEVPFIGTNRELFFALLLVVTIRFIPNGLLGLKEFDGLILGLKRRFSRRKEADDG